MFVGAVLCCVVCVHVYTCECGACVCVCVCVCVCLLWKKEEKMCVYVKRPNALRHVEFTLTKKNRNLICGQLVTCRGKPLQINRGMNDNMIYSLI